MFLSCSSLFPPSALYFMRKQRLQGGGAGCCIILCMKPSREAQDSYFHHFAFFFLMSFSYTIFTWVAPCYMSLFQPCSLKLPFFPLLLFQLSFPPPSLFLLVLSVDGRSCHYPDYVLLLLLCYLFILIQKHFLSCTVIWSQFCFIGM